MQFMIYLTMETVKNSICKSLHYLQGCNYRPCRPCPAMGPRTQAAQAGTTQNIKKFCELCWGRNGHERTNHLHRTMHILAVISSVSRSSKCNKIIGGWASPQTPLGELTALQQIP